MLDIAAWFDSLPDPELKLLRNTRKGWEDTYLGKVRRGAGWADYRLNLMMPVSLNQEAGFIPSTSGDWGERLMEVLALKGTVSRDFLLLVFFMNQFPPSPRVSH
jgi:hypothetical protein